jgi:hypothetical protein
MATNSSKYKLTGVNGSEIQISLNGPTGPTGPANVLNIGNVTTAETGVPAAASITGSSPSQLLHLTLPKGNTGTAATIAVGATTTGEAGSSASVTNGGSSSAAVFNFTIPKGDKGNTGTLSLGTVATGNAGTDVIITNTGTPEAGEFNFTIPRGNTGLTGPANQLSVNPTVTGAAGTDASVVISGTAPSQTLSFTIPRGNTGLTGPTGPANQLSVNPTVTGAAGTDASVVISGTAPSQTLSFTIPRGDTGATGSSGAVSLLTGFASAAGTVAETDTILAAVGKLDGNIALRATTASLYPYIGGKLLTYLDEEDAIADPLISAGDIYRKSAGGVDYVNPDNVPSLDLRFADDKTLTARRGPTPTFTRGSGATYIGSDGLIHGIDTSTTSNSISAASKTFTLDATAGQDQLWRTGDAVEASNGSNIMTGTVTSYDATTQSLVCNMTTASGTGTFTSWRIGYRGPRFDHDPISRTNLLVRSNELNISPWGPATVTVEAVAGSGLDGGNAWRLTPTGSDSALGQARTIAASSPHTFSVWLKSDTGSNVSLSLSVWDNTASTNRGLKSITVTTQWQRFDITTSTVVAGNSTSFNIGTFASWTTGENILAWGAQLEAGSTATSYIPTTTAPVTIRDCRGLLIEEGRQNLFQYSEIFNEADSSNYWDSATANAVTSNQTTSPDGAATADLLTTSTTSFDCFVRRTINWVGSTQYSYSIFLKRGPSNHRYVGLYIGAGITGALQYPYFDFDNPTTVQIPSGTMVGTINSTRVDAYPNGWYRVSVTFTTAATPVTIYGGVYVSTSNGTLSSTPTAGLDCYIWGIQAETGSFPTSYIPTTTGTLARSADVCNITGDDFSGFYNQSEGTLTVKVEEFRRGTSYNTVVEIFNGLSYSGNRLGVVFGGLRSGVTSPLEISLFSGGPAQYQTATTSTSSGYTAAIAYATDNVRGSLNGNLLAADTPPSNVNIGANTIRFGSIGIHIAAVRFYKKRLPNAKLQALTV